ncbi:hypothetical protein LCGC14_0607820 [marine sediment metagenome]|uniref:Uncharacterized protein n=1 Tax=marine sediment metagenome TaxID=412755 RepID=A0A0F9R8T5_9ZZZZ
MSFEETLKTVLETATAGVSAGVHALRKPIKSTLPAVVYKRITTLPHQHHKSVGVAGLVKRDRMQITYLADSYAKLIALVGLVDSALVGNVTSFSAVQPLGSGLEDKSEDSKVYESIKDYYIFHKE